MSHIKVSPASLPPAILHMTQSKYKYEIMNVFK